MIIKKLELIGYRRFSLSNINKLTYTPENNIQIILATNGAGKSSLVRECSPLPADIKKDYLEGGSKYIEIEHGNSYYKISSGIVGKNKHSFSKDGIELNTVGIRKIQLQLVEEHFKLTPQIHEVLLGNVVFTNMSTADRKKWLTMLSDIDYSYPISIFNKLKSRHRDILGAIKITQGKLLQSDMKVLTSSDMGKMKKDLYILNKFVEYMLSIKTSITYESTDWEDSVISSTSLLSNNISKITNLDGINNNNIESKIAVTESSLNTVNQQITNINNKLKKLSDDIDMYKANLGYTDVAKNIKKCEEDMREIESKNILNLNLNNIDTIYELFNYVYSDFISLMGELDNLSSIKYDNTLFTTTEKELRNNESKIKILTTNIDKLNGELKVLEENKSKEKIQCVNCNHTWHLNYDPTRYNVIKETLEEYGIKYDKLQSDNESLKSLFAKLSEKNKILLSLKKIITANDTTLPILRYILDGNDIQDNVTNIINKANNVSIMLSELVKYTKINNLYSELMNKLKLISATDVAKHDNMVEDKKILENELNNLLIKRTEYLSDIDTYKQYKSNMDSLYKSYQSLKDAIKNSSDLNKKSIENLRNNELNKVIKEFKYIISDIEKRIADSELVSDRINTAKLELDRYIETEKVIKLALKELSPTEGLIAKSINSFLNVFITEVNIIINKVWTYDMSLLPCVVSDDNDLDYKFPVTIDNNETIADISMGSSSMKEIIDLAFKIVFMKYLGITDTPLILDEFGKTMDPLHRVNAYNIIEKLLVDSFPQVFIISHFESMYGQFKDSSDISILNSDNLTIDKNLEYNNVMKIS